MPYSRISYAVLICALFLLFCGEAAYAGCPAFPPQEKRITVAECRFYDAAQDLALRKKVDQHFTDWPDADDNQILSYKNAVYARNTGAIIAALNADGSRFELFYHTGSPDTCAEYPVGETQTVFTIKTCAMVFFAAPTTSVIVPEPPAGGRGHDIEPSQPEDLE